MSPAAVTPEAPGLFRALFIARRDERDRLEAERARHR
jgi:hypothetical protein